jgi:hypothetical protein
VAASEDQTAEPILITPDIKGGELVESLPAEGPLRRTFLSAQSVAKILRDAIPA